MTHAKVRFYRTLVISALLAASAGMPRFVQADDTDVFFTNQESSGSRSILILLDNNSNWSENSQGFPGQTTGQAELNAIKAAISTLDDSTSVGLMQFVTTEGGGATGGFVRYHMRPMTAANKLALNTILTTIHDNINDADEKINASAATYGELMRDAYNYLDGGLSVSPSKVLASKADPAGYTSAYTRFKSPLSGNDSVCGPVSIIFVSNPAPSNPQSDTTENTAALAALGGNTEQLQLPAFTVSTITASNPIGLTSACYASVSACQSKVQTADFASQCGTAGACTCDGTVTSATLATCTSGQRYTVAGVTNTSIISDGQPGTTSTNQSTGLSACMKASDYVAGNVQTCPANSQSTTTSGGTQTDVFTTWSNCTAINSPGSSCGTGGRKSYPINGTKNVRTQTSANPPSVTYSSQGNTFACLTSSANCNGTNFADYANCSNGTFNGGCVCQGPTTTTGTCPSGNRFQVLSNFDTTLVTPTGALVNQAAPPYNMDEWARFLRRIGVKGKKVSTYTIDVFKNAQGPEYTRLMLSAAKVSDGRYFSATNQSEIVNAFTEIFEEVLAIDTTFVAPAVTVNTFNRLTNRNELYFALFKPAAEIKWEGNLKKYKFGTVGGGVQIVDADGAEAVDSSTGFFKSGARSIWSAQIDGPEVVEGGMTSNLSNARNAYTYTGADKPPSANPVPVDLSASGNLIDPANTSITRAMVGLLDIAPALDFTNLLKWARGIDVDDFDRDNDTTDPRTSIGDPLHSQPVVIPYKGTDASPDLTIYFGDNEGSLYAVNGSNGQLVFSFTPKETLIHLSKFRSNTSTRRDRPYGLDGPVARLHNDLNGDLLPLNPDGSIQSGEFVYLYVGMRRGGRNYYSLDVTDRSAPKLRWVIYGGSGDYAELGQSWSRPVVTKIKFNGEIRDVIIFSGGYDPAQDGKSVLSADGQGRAVYIADARTGQRLWWASSAGSPNLTLSNMVYSTPASPRVIDLDSDGLADRIYMSDAGGQIFRIILNPGNTGASNLASGRRIAVLSDADSSVGSRTAANARRFFASPDLALINKGATMPFLSISIGSGFREKPTSSNNHDRFYVLRDPDDEIDENSALSIVEADLYDATDNLLGQGDAATVAVEESRLAASKGFYINLVDDSGAFVGEKVIGDSVTFDNKVIFSSFQSGTPENACSVAGGRSRLYLLNVINGTPVGDLSNYTSGTPADCSGTACTKDDRYISLRQQGLPPDPTLMFPSLGGTLPDEALVCIGAECFAPGLSVVTKKTYWLKKSN